MAQDKYIIRPTITQTEAEADLGDGQSSLVDGDGTETAYKHAHRIGDKVYTTANNRVYDKNTDTWSFPPETFGELTAVTELNVGENGDINLHLDGAGNGIIDLQDIVNVSHPFTSIVPEHVWARLCKVGLVGGAKIIGISDSFGSAGISLLGLSLAGCPGPNIVLDVGKSDGAGGYEAIGNAHIVVDVKNGGTGVARIYGNGDASFDGSLSVVGNVKMKVFNQASAPTTSDIPSGFSAMWTDTDDSKCYLCYNHGGTIKKVELT